MEIISETNRQHDVITKMVDYANAQIPEYWIVDPTAKSVEVFVLVDGKYQTSGVSDQAQSKVMTGLVVDVVDLFEQAENQA